jgi:segregation and condensation protein B
MSNEIKMPNELISKIEAILFYSGEPVEVSFLSKVLEEKEEDILQAVEELGKVLVRRGIRLMLHEGEASLVTAPEYSSIIENILKEERERELGRAGIETLAIIAYKGPLSRKEVEYVRGVNSQFAIRTLLLRGLIEKKQSDENGRAMVYTITSDTLRHLGLQHISELPEYESSRTQLEVTEEPEEQLEETEGETSEYSS